MDKFKEFLRKHKHLLFGFYLCSVLILASIATTLYKKRLVEKVPVPTYESVDTNAEDEAVMAPDENYSDNITGTLPPQIPEEIEDIRSALPFTSRRFDAFYDEKTDTFIVDLKLEFSNNEKRYVKDWFERFPEFDDGDRVKITWVDKTQG